MDAKKLLAVFYSRGNQIPPKGSPIFGKNINFIWVQHCTTAQLSVKSNAVLYRKKWPVIKGVKTFWSRSDKKCKTL